MTVALITLNPLAIVQQWSAPPARIAIDGVGDVHGIAVGWTSGNYMLASVALVGSPVDQFSQLQSSSLSLSGSTLTITRTYTQRAATKAELKAYAASKRAQKAASGTQLGQTAIPTDLDTRTMLLGFYVKSLATPAFTARWLTPDGWITLNATNIQNAAQQVGLFLADCLEREATAYAGIDGSPQTISTFAEIDAIFAA